MNKIKNDKIFKHHNKIQCAVIVDKTAHSHKQVPGKQNIYLYSYFKHKYKHLTLYCNNWNKYILNI